MKVLCILLCVAFANGFYIDNNGTHEDKIVGGDYVRIEDVPYHASLLWFREDDFCGATIIHQSWVITAAHCVNHKWDIYVRIGSEYRRTFVKVHRADKIIMHENFDANSKRNDIALIKLARPIQFNGEQEPIELAKPHDILREGELVRISGFGQIGEHMIKSDVLKAAYIPVRNQRYCERAYMRHLITNKMFCAGNGDADACYGDSGGPGVIRGKLYGIISFGTDCTSTIFPAVLTRVSKYYGWIEEKTRLRF